MTKIVMKIVMFQKLGPGVVATMQQLEEMKRDPGLLQIKQNVIQPVSKLAERLIKQSEGLDQVAEQKYGCPLSG